MGKDEEIEHLDWKLDPIKEPKWVNEFAANRVYVDSDESWFVRHNKLIAGLTAASVLLGGGFLLGRNTAGGSKSPKIEQSDFATYDFQPPGPIGPIGTSKP